MVQKSRIAVKFLWAVVRIALFVGIIALSAFISDPFHSLILDHLHYQIPEGFFSGSWADWSLAWVLTNVFLSGVIFGTLGKKIDYAFIAAAIGIAIWEFTGTANVTSALYITLLTTIAISNIVGFCLKLVRERFLPKLKI